MIKMLIDYGADIGVALCMVGLNRPSLYHKARFEDMLNAPTIGYKKLYKLYIFEIISLKICFIT